MIFEKYIRNRKNLIDPNINEYCHYIYSVNDDIFNELLIPLKYEIIIQMREKMTLNA
jgi:hypothetical protein